MKRGTFDHPKLLELAATLGVRKYAAAGILEGIWAWTARYTPQGNIGKYTDSAIAAAVDWDGNPASMVLALIQNRWLDLDDEHRLLVHDWQDHCDQTTDRYLKSHNLPYLKPHASMAIEKTSLPVPVPVSVPVSVPPPLAPPDPAVDDPKGKPKGKKKDEPKPKKDRPANPFADAFKAAFDEHFPEPYSWSNPDFIQLAQWRKKYPSVTPERFAQVARACWGQGEYTPNASLSIMAFCPRWAQLAAKVQETTNGRTTVPGSNKAPTLYSSEMVMSPESAQRMLGPRPGSAK